MGVPSFFWWLLNKYRKTISDALEEREEHEEFDNFYLDLNEIIHPCFLAANNVFAPTNSDEIYVEILKRLFKRIDRLVNMVRPRKLLFMAIDGVAPRAKMNVIRAGRFQLAKFNQIAEEIKDKLREEFEKEGKSLLPKEETHGADGIMVTPGTEFMHMLSKNLQTYITKRMSKNPAWGEIKVILSDDTVPGEGEHKIMSFIRAQRSSPNYDPNTRHCVYGTDADLIMLALATHEVHFSILREEPIRGDRRAVCQFLNICVLREYLALDLEIPNSNKLQYDLERIIDDFIFICFFAGNDFLPRMPTLQTQEGCIDLLMHVYKEEFQNFGGYLVDMQKDNTGSYINVEGVETFILAVGAYEDKIFSKRSENRDRKFRRNIAEYRDSKDDEENHLDEGRVSAIMASYADAGDVDEVLLNTLELQLKLKNCLITQYDLFEDGLGVDKVKFGFRGWRERYYKEKFSAQTPDEIEATRKAVVEKYSEGLCWLLLYYFHGVPSWSWFYPYYYGPLASDLKGLSQTKVEFQKGLPFKPFDQLMGVLPPTSAHLLPVAYKRLMTDKNSKVVDFYPTEFETDIDGKRYPWKGIFKLPFIDEERLLMETRKLENELKDHEQIRNSETLDLLFVRCSGETSQQDVWRSGSRAPSEKIKGAVLMDSAIEGIRGTLHLTPEELIEAADDDNNKGEHSRNLLCMFYEINEGFQHVPRLLESVNTPQKMVNKEDLKETILWHEQHGRGSSGIRNRFHNQRLIEQDSSKNSATAFTSQGSSRFGLDRGETSSATCLDSPDSDKHAVISRAVAGDHQPSEYNGRSNAGSSRSSYGGTGGLRGSDMNRRPMSNNRHRQGGSSFWQSHSGVTYDTNDDWRSNKLSGQTQRNESFSSNAAGHGRGSSRWK